MIAYNSWWKRVLENFDGIIGVPSIIKLSEHLNSQRHSQVGGVHIIHPINCGPQGGCTCGPQAPQMPSTGVWPSCGPACCFNKISGTQGPEKPKQLDPECPEWSFTDYQREALITSECPLIGHSIVYPFLGLSGEIGEVYEKVSVAIKGDMQRVWNNPHRKDIILEMGDVLWYMSVMAHELNFPLYSLGDGEDGSMSQLTPNKPHGVSGKGISYDLGLVMDELVINQGKLCERIKKVFRDKNGQFEGFTKNNVVADLRKVFTSFVKLCRFMKIDLSLVAHMNIEKLRSRRERNAIQGEGDNR